MHNVMDFMGERILIAAGGLRLFCGLMFASLLIFVACEPGTPSAPELNNSQNQLVLSKVVAVGASFTAGFQSGGMVEDFQLKSFPSIIAQQIGKADQFELPLNCCTGYWQYSRVWSFEI